MHICGRHLTYCTNIHAGEQWDEHFAELRHALPIVKRHIAPQQPFGVGLRLSAAAAHELRQPQLLQQFRDFLDENGLYVFTLNGFPYGAFHGQRVKEQVYQPDWRSPQRLAYTMDLIHVLAALLPEGIDGSISTVPLGFRADFRQPEAFVHSALHLVDVAMALVDIKCTSGHTIRLALEPEPSCALETTAEAVAFFTEFVFQGAALQQMAHQCGGTEDVAQALLRTHLGLCIDACHAAVMFENPQTIQALLTRHQIEVAKLQLSAGLQVAPVTSDALVQLQTFVDSVYLHQVMQRDSTGLTQYLDLPAALDQRIPSLPAEWRIHFHVPLFHAAEAPLQTTRSELLHWLAEPLATHLEVETYTWDVLPAELQSLSKEQAIVRELEWVLGKLVT